MFRGNKRAGVLLNIAFLLFAPMAVTAVTLRPSLARLSRQDTLCKVWVIFTDKNGSPRTAVLSRRALERRGRMGAAGVTDADIAISSRYLAGLDKFGCRVGQLFKWANAASVTVHASRLSDLAGCAYVKDIVGVRSYRSIVAKPRSPGLAKRAGYDSSGFYGASYGQLAMLNVPAVHRFIESSLSAAPGDGVTIGLFDSGFRTKHACFSLFNAGGHMLADSDFIDHDGTVADPDSVANNSTNPYYHNDEHGSRALSLIAGYDPPRFAGVAWGATFILARTEDTKLLGNREEIEKHCEEDNWAAAMVWAESLGVDIVSSSLGYRDGFTPPDTDYTYRDMDGRTTIISKAARQAVSFGVIVVNAMGNDGPGPGSLDAPADVDSVISVGAVDNTLTIAHFSGRGPTSDGRIKPDCVALGVEDAVPAVYGPDSISYGSGSGTSFAAPLVAGLCALIKQTHPNDLSSVTTRDRLFSSCVFVPGQIAMDNTFGRGLPNAKLACLPYNIMVTITDTLNRMVRGTVFYRTGTTGAFNRAPTDSQGTARMTDLTAAAVELYAEAPGYLGSAHRQVLPLDTGIYRIIMTLLPRPVSQFVIFPNVLDINKKHQHVTLEFMVSPDDPRNFSAAIRSIDGALVWTTSQYLPENRPLVLTWPPAGRKVAPGVYFIIVNYAGRTYRQKFMVTG